MKELTKAEEQIMQVLWDLKKGFIKDILERLPEPKPAYNTVSTIVRILEKKGFIKHKAYGKTHEYSPAVSKKKYTSASTDKLLKNYFNGSMESMLSFFVKEKKIDVKELDAILKQLESDNK